MTPDLRSRSGMTLVEIMIAMVVGVMVLGVSMNFTVQTFRGVESASLREDLFRTGRFIGSSLERDLANTGVAIQSQERSGTLMAKGDTLVIVSVPYDSIATAPFTALTPTYSMPTGLATPATAGIGNCGTRCVTVQGSATDTVKFGVGSMVQMMVDNERRFINVTRKTARSSNRYDIEFSVADSLMLHPANWTRPDPSATPLLLRPAETSFQRISPVMYYRNSQNQLIRATRLDAGNVPVGDVVADGVTSVSIWLFYADGDSARRSNPDDFDDSNDHNDLAAVSYRVTLRGSRAERGVFPTRTFEWRYAPRNLAYERNRY